MTKPPLEIVLFFQGDDPCISEMPEMPEPIARRAGIRVLPEHLSGFSRCGTLFSAFHTAVLAYHAQSHVQPVTGKVIARRFKALGSSATLATLQVVWYKSASIGVGHS